ncbi:MAG: histidine phosphatase family protein [Halopseudomonas sp.]
MKRLILIRHAKSSWKQPQLSDHERPLNKRGKRSIELMRQHLAKQPPKLEMLYSSSATRALTTAVGLADAVSIDGQVEIADTLYDFDWQPIWRFLSHQPDALCSLALVGHNPALQQLYQQITLETLDHLPTCGLLELELEIESWDQLAAGCGQLSQSIFPKQLLDR